MTTDVMLGPLAAGVPGCVPEAGPMDEPPHANTARAVNDLDGLEGRQVWHNFWDKHLTYEKSYLARLNYVHQNAVKHGLAPVANQYPWCSAAWPCRRQP